jgi:hypothetical protein
MQIDTGISAPQVSPLVASCPDWLRDQLPEDASDERIALAIAHTLIGDLRKYKRMAGARKALLYRWTFLAALAEVAPETFDHVLTEYVERVMDTPVD